MINFRFHIVSLTAVLLALGLGLVLGTAFLDEAVIDALRGQLDGLESDLDSARDRAGDMRSDMDVLEEEQEAMDVELTQHVLAQVLAGQPVLVVKPEGLDGELVDRVREGLLAAEADLVGEWELTDRFTLDDEGEVSALAEALDLTTDDSDRLRSSVVAQLADVLYGATDADVSANPDAPGLRAPQGDDGTATADGTEAVPEEPVLLTNLREAGFVSYTVPEGSESDEVLVPPGGLRVLVLSGPEAGPLDPLLHETVSSLASEGRVPVVVAGVSALAEEDDGGGDEGDEDGDEVLSLVETVRQDEALRERMATVDNVDRVAGKVAIALALREAAPGDPLLGHYGQGEGADQLLPPPGAGPGS